MSEKVLMKVKIREKNEKLKNHELTSNTIKKKSI